MKELLKKKGFWLLLVILLFGIGIVLHLTCNTHCFSLQNIQRNSIIIKNFIDSHYWTSIFVFWCIYVLENIFALPLAAGMTIAAGYFYGVIPAIILTLISACCGAAASFLLARYVLGNFLQKTYAVSLQRFNRAFDRHGAYYLLFVRFLPFIPFVLVNMLAGLTLVPFSTFIITTAIGFLPLTVMYALAGREFYAVVSGASIFSWHMILVLGGLAILTIAPLIVKKVMNGQPKKA